MSHLQKKEKINEKFSVYFLCSYKKIMSAVVIYKANSQKL